MSPSATAECRMISLLAELPPIEKNVWSAPKTRGVALGFGHGPRVVVQGTELSHRNGEVGSQHLLAVEAEKGAADGRLHEGRTARVPGRVPRVLMGVG